MNGQQWHKINQTTLLEAIAALRLCLQEDTRHTFSQVWEALPQTNSLSYLQETFNLTTFELQLIVLCAGVQLDTELAALCARRSPPYPNFQMALSCLPDAHWTATAPEAPLRYWQIVIPIDSQKFLQSRLQLDAVIFQYLMGIVALPDPLIGLVQRHPTLSNKQHFHPHTVDQIIELHQNTKQRRVRLVPIIILNGRDRASCQATAAHAYDQLQIQMLSIHAQELPTTTAERVRFVRLLERESLLNSAAVYLDAHHLPATQLPIVQAFANHFSGLMTIGTQQPIGNLKQASMQFEIPRPKLQEQIDLWNDALGALAAPLNGSMAQLARQFDLDATMIQSLGARLQTEIPHGEQSVIHIEDRLWELCSEQGQPELETLCQRIDSNAQWDDLVLPPEQKDILREIGIHVYHRFQVYYDWGFADLNRRGLGITALFAGDSGTGKTLAAEILANYLRLMLYRIDLSSVVSKYIGETEKNLARIFDAAEATGAVLLFDEADALFGKRSEVKDAHDRYANIEVSYLLQRMESYRGLAILTTNFQQNLDTAFQRRLRFIVQFPFPAYQERLRIWQRIFPSQTPIAELDFERLAQLAVSGGNIKSIALRAAFYAAHDDKPITMRHISHAARSEYRKLGKPLTNAELKGWINDSLETR